MTMRETMMAVRDWAALAGAFAMVGFLTFAPQHAPVAMGGDVAAHRSTGIAWPSRTAELSPETTALR